MGMGNSTDGGSIYGPFPGMPGPGAGDLAGRYRKSSGRIFTQQNGTVQDLISEGEIEGLVGGTSGVYLNETPLSNSSVVTSQGPRFGLASTTATSTTVNSATSDLFTGIDLAAGLRVVQIQGAEHQTTLASAASAGATSITVTNAFTSRSAITWVQGFVKNSLSFANITIAGAGPDGDDYVGTLVFATGTSGTVSPAVSTSVSSGATVEVDFFSPINTVVDGDTIGTAQAVPVSVTNAAIQVLPPIVTSTADANFSNANVSFYKGTRTQAAAPRSNAAAVSFIHAPSTPELQQSTDTLGSGSVSIVNSSLSGTSQPTQSPRTFTASVITGGASSDIIKEIDTLSVEFELPAGLGYFVQDGDFQEAVVEIQIAVEFDRGGNTEEVILINQNTKLNGSNQFVRQRAGLANPYPANFSDKSTTPDGLIIGETQGSFLASYSLDLTPYQPFDDFTLKIARISPEIFENYTTQRGLDKGENALLACNIKTIQAGIFEKLSYPNSAYAVTQFSAEDFDTPPARAYHIRGKKVKVPSNYITREEINPASPNSQAAKYTRNISTGVDESSYQSWDGSFRGDESLAITHPNYSKVYTNNPAWVFYDILTNKTYGLGDFLNEEDIDIYSLYQIARYCDELVPDGKGGLEPRFACNAYITSQQEAYKVLKDLASCFRGMMYWIDGEIVGVQDRPKEPVYTFTQGNVIDGLFSYEYTGQRARINQVNVTWNDPEQFYRQSVVTVDDFDNIAEQNRLVSKDVVAFGCTSEGQATRVGRWHLLTDTQETEIVKFQTSINAGFLRPGDWIKIQDAKADNVEFSGRVSTGSTTTSIELDRDVVLQTGQSYNLYLIYPEAGCYLQQESATINSTSYVRGDLILTDAGGSPIETSEDAANLVDDSGDSVFTSFSKNSRLEKQAISSTGTVSTLVVSSAFSSAPGSDVIWAVSNVNEQRVDAPVTYRILGISEDAPNLYSIVGAKVITEKYDELEKKWAVYVDPYKPVASKDEAVPAPSNLKVEIVPTPGVDADSSGSSLRAIVSWNEPTETFVDSNGTTETTKYRFIDSYEIQHSFYNSRTTPITALSAGRNSITFDNINTSGEVIFRIRTRNTSGQRSPFVSVVRTAAPSQIPAPTFDRLSKIVLGGQINSPIAFNTSTGLIEISNSNYLFVSSIGKRYDVVGATTAQSDVDFSSLSSGDTGYWYFDFSDTSDPWKTMIEHTDTTVENTSGTTTNFSYWKELGASNNGLTLATGTVSLAAGSDEVTGVSTSFTTDFAVGDLIKLSTNNTYTEEADAEYFEVAFVESDTKLFVRRNATKTFSGDYAYKQSFKPDFINDNILASVTNTAGTFSISYFVLKSGEAGADGAQGVDGVRGSISFIFEESTTAGLSATDVQGFTEDITFTDTHAQNVAALAINDASDGFIRPNDRITVTDNSANLAGTRIYNGSAVDTVSGIDTGDFSSLVVETFDGSVIVEGTLAADRLAADTAVVNGLSVQSELSVGTSGVLRSGKTAFNTGTGWYLDFNAGTPRFDLGDPSGNNLQWDGTSLSVTGTINIENPGDIVQNSLINPEFEAGDIGWDTSPAQWSINENSSLARRGTYYLEYSGSSSSVCPNEGEIQCAEGDIIQGQINVNVISGVGRGTARLAFRDSSGNYISGSFVDGNEHSSSGWGLSRVQATAPAGAVSAYFEAAVLTSGSTVVRFDGSLFSLIPKPTDYDATELTNGPADSGATNNGSTVNTSGNIAGSMTMLSGGGITLSSGGFIKSLGKDSLTDGTSGFFLGYDGSSSYDFSVGNSSKFLRWDGSAGTLSIGGDVVASGNIQANAVTTPKIQDEAATKLAFAFEAGPKAMTSSTLFLNVDSATITSTGKPLRIEINAYFQNGASSGSTYCFARVTRGGTVLSRVSEIFINGTFSGDGGTNVTYVYEETPSAGTHTYNLQVKTGGVTIDVIDCAIAVREVKK